MQHLAFMYLPCVCLPLIFLVHALAAYNDGCTVEKYRAFTGVRVMKEWDLIDAPRAATKFFENSDPHDLRSAAQRYAKGAAAIGGRGKSGAPQFRSRSAPRNFVVLYCEAGELMAEIRVDPADLFNTTHCASDLSGWCVRFARRQRDVRRSNWSLALPGSLIGGVYTTSSNDCSIGPDQLTPYAPFQVESRRNWGLALRAEAAFFRLPMFRTPEVKEKTFPRTSLWSQYLNPFEVY